MDIFFENSGKPCGMGLQFLGVIHKKGRYKYVRCKPLAVRYSLQTRTSDVAYKQTGATRILLLLLDG